jgi:leucyl aminopeptidase
VTDCFADSAEGAVPITALSKNTLQDWLGGQDARVRTWVEAAGFDAKRGTVALVPGDDARLARVLVGRNDKPSMWDYAGLAASLPAGTYRIDDALAPDAANRAAIAWGLGTYAFSRYKKENSKVERRLAIPEGAERAVVEATVAATFLVRDLINTPADDMGPPELAAAAGALAKEHGADFSTIVGDDLVAQNFPSIFAVGRASHKPPHLIDLRWGKSGPKVTLVGKGVCFDSGGLDLKTATGMKLMKKDMGGGAHVLGVAKIVMATGLKVQLRVLIPAVENSVSGSALHPMDVIKTRSGLTVEIGNTDAEGRVVLADALAEAASEKPDLIVDFATLTGAARVALGTELPALFTNDDAFAATLLKHGEAEEDPLWRMPLWQGYTRLVEGKTADLTNAPEGGFGGAITAALFLEKFGGSVAPWAHIDLMAWNTSSRPGRPEGAEAMAMRAVYAVIAEMAGS